MSFPQNVYYVSVRSAYATFKMRIRAGVWEVLLLTEFIIFLGCIGAEKNVDS